MLAIKQVPVNSDLQEIIKEISIMQQCDSPYIVKYYGSYFKNTDLWVRTLLYSCHINCQTLLQRFEMYSLVSTSPSAFFSSLYESYISIASSVLLFRACLYNLHMILLLSAMLRISLLVSV